jgi:hypothetical protein
MSNKRLSICGNLILARVLCAVSVQPRGPVRLRNYSVSGNEMPDCCIWQACRATSAAPTFFTPILINNQQYVDGALGYNNPIMPLMDEVSRIWGDKHSNGVILSIGTGVPRLGTVGEGATLAKTLKEMATDTQTVANEFRNEIISKYGPDQQLYFRFNVERGLEELGLEDCQPRHQAQIQTATNLYLEGIADQIEICARRIYCPIGKQDYDELEDVLRDLDPTKPIEYISTLPTYLGRDPDFQGQDEILSQMRQTLEFQPRVALQGLGGVG